MKHVCIATPICFTSCVRADKGVCVEDDQAHQFIVGIEDSASGPRRLAGKSRLFPANNLASCLFVAKIVNSRQP